MFYIKLVTKQRLSWPLKAYIYILSYQIKLANQKVFFAFQRTTTMVLLQLRGQRRSKFETVSNDKNNKANLLIMDRKTKCPRSPYGLTYHLMLKFMPNVIISVIGQMHITHKQGIEKGGNIVPRT